MVQRRTNKRMKGGAVELQQEEYKSEACSTASECNSQLLTKQADNAEQQIEMSNHAGGGQEVSATVVEGSSEQDAVLQERIQQIALEGQANAEFDKNAGKVGGKRGKRGKRSSRKRSSRKRSRRGKRSSRKRSSRGKRGKRKRKTKRKRKRKSKSKR